MCIAHDKKLVLLGAFEIMGKQLIKTVNGTNSDYLYSARITSIKCIHDLGRSTVGGRSEELCHSNV